MRLKAIIKYHFSNTKISLSIFYAFLIAGTLFGATIAALTRSVVIMGVAETGADGITSTWSTSIISFAIFVMISALLLAQKETRFLITRSASRKEIFLSNTIVLVMLSAILSALQIVTISFDAATRKLFGVEETFRGMDLDVQCLQAPNMRYIPIFFIVSFSILLCIGALSYLFGSCLARWKVITLGVVIIGGLTGIACLAFPDVIMWIADTFKFMFTDDKTGLFIALKQIALATVVFALTFPVMRRITAAKQSQ